MLFAWWRRLPRERRNVWMIIGCGVVGVSAAKTGYYHVTRNLLVQQSDRRHKEAVEKLKESYEFADWSHRERERQLPELTPDQRRQMNKFLNLMMEHEMNKYIPDDKRRAPTPKPSE
ncbi:expressed unknown protein [Seminavis robusta]|uniref:Uncharacterized protein n=1 Tax=Seminavis robusta TaxID=568900 RepID=A0A9N8DXS9_9STRA|nr:expressed unknown protein [Seminavis robusta]|eukprot:Sro326_g117980.1 n/a (117) ;mRNA; r:9490-9989